MNSLCCNFPEMLIQSCALVPVVLQPKEIGLPFTAYTAIDEVREVGVLVVPAQAAGRALLSRRRPQRVLREGCVCQTVAFPTALAEL